MNFSTVQEYSWDEPEHYVYRYWIWDPGNVLHNNYELHRYDYADTVQLRHPPSNSFTSSGNSVILRQTPLSTPPNSVISSGKLRHLHSYSVISSVKLRHSPPTLRYSIRREQQSCKHHAHKRRWSKITTQWINITIQGTWCTSLFTAGVVGAKQIHC